MMEHGHSKQEIEERFSRPPQQNYLRDWIYGGIDGAITTFAIVTAAVGGHLSSLVILILGFANLVADGFSMAVSNYLGTRSEQQLAQNYMRTEQRHIEQYPEGERREVRQILINQGYEAEQLETMTALITAKRQQWINFMLCYEYGITGSPRSSWKAAVATFVAFLLCGFVPLLPYLVPLTHQLLVSVVMTGLVFFGIGTVKSQWTGRPWWLAGTNTFLIGMSAALIAFFVGRVIAGLV